MPKSRQKSQKDRNSDDEYCGPSQSQAGPSQTQTFTQAQKAHASMDRGEQEKRLNDLVQFLLVMDQKKLPIKKQDINKHVLKEFSKAFPVMIDLAAQKLKKVFGIELVPLDDKFKGSYILVNNVDVDTDDLDDNSGFNPVEQSDDENALNGLLMVVLSLVFMNGKVMQDSQLWHVLRKLGIDQDQPHECFGDVKKTITTDFVKQGYLEFTRQPNTDPPVFDIRWGQRAKTELPPRYCLQFVSQPWICHKVICKELQKYMCRKPLILDMLRSDDENALNGLLMVVLSLVFMNGKVMQDSQLWHVLRKLGIDQDQPHECFGDVKKTITTDFVKQGYLEFTRQPNTDPPVFDVRWGQRAKIELPPRYCLQFVSQLYEKEPEQWTSQWQMVLEDEGIQPENGQNVPGTSGS